MNTLNINASIDSLSALTPISTNTYQFVARFFNSAGNYLNNSNIPNEYTDTVTTTNTSFVVQVPITNGNYTIPNVTVKLYANAVSNCCFAQYTTTITNTTGSTGNLRVGGAYNTTGEAFKTYMFEGTAPYSLTAKNDAGTTIYSTSASTDEIQIPNTVTGALGSSGIKISVTDAAGKTGTLEYCGVSFDFIKRVHGFRSITNGSPDDHIAGINAGDAKGFDATGVIFGANTFQTDAEFMEFESFVLPLNATYNPSAKYGFDRTVITARDKTNANQLKVQLDFTRDYTKLNNGTDRTLFYSESALAQRPDGSKHMAVGVNANVMVPSCASPEFLTFQNRYALAFFNRYSEYIHAGIIIVIGGQMTTSAEDEYEFVYKDVGGALPPALGDFHPSMIAAFKAQYPAYASLNNDAIGNADRNGSQLAKDWSWHLENMYRKSRNKWTDYVIANSITFQKTNPRKKWRLCDAGSWVDELAPRRRNLNQMNKQHPSTLMIKSNDGPADSGNQNRNKYILDHITSMAIREGAVASAEPSPASQNYSPAADGPVVVQEMAYMKQVGMSISFYAANSSDIDYLISASAFNIGQTPLYKNFLDSSKKFNTANISLGAIYAGGSFGAGENAYNTFRTNNPSIANVDIKIVDDVKPVTVLP